MNLPEQLSILRWLAHDTFRQARASGILWLMLGINALAIVFCLSVGMDEPRPLREGDEPAHFLPRTEKLSEAQRRGAAVEPITGDLTLLFGAVRVPLFRDGHAGVRFIKVVLAKWVAGTAGLLLTLIWTAGFLPSFLEPGAATVLLAKPTPRWLLLLGKYLGVLAFVALTAGIFFVGTWLALGLRTGLLAPEYLLSYPLLLLQFLIIYSASAVLAVWTRSTVVCVFGSILFWLVCFGMNYGRHALVALPFLDPLSTALPASATYSVEIGYWCLPKPADLGILLDNLLGTREHFTGPKEFAVVQEQGAFQPWLSVFSSLAFSVLGLVIAARHLEQTDY